MALHHVKSGEPVDLRPLGPNLKDAKTAAIIKSDRFEAIRVIVRAGTEIPSHEVSGNITLIVDEGAAIFHGMNSPLEHKNYDDDKCLRSVQSYLCEAALGQRLVFAA